MSQIVNLKIKNFRGIKDFDENFNNSFVCLIGRGDSCKTTILDAISCVLSPTWNLSFDDNDFYKCDSRNTIEIEITVVALPEDLLTENKYGLYVRRHLNGEILDDIDEDEGDDAITIRLTVGKSLEPKWIVRNFRNNEEKEMSASDRAKLNCFFIFDCADRHFSFSKGNLLYSLLRISKQEIEDSSIVEILRDAKRQIDTNGFESLKDIILEVENKAAELGVNVKDSTASIDSSDIIVKNGRLCLHDSETIPYRLKGKGTKRLLSMAIQLSLLDKGGILLIDEVEQGLEPDRIRHMVNLLKDYSEHAGQVVLTTHSRDAIVELDASDLHITKKSNDFRVSVSKLTDSDKIQRAVRACPEAFFAKKLIICEGKTEIGICRAIEKHCRKARGKEAFSFHDTSTLLGDGGEVFARAAEIFKTGAFNKLSLFVDSDVPSGNEKKESLRERGVIIFDSENSLNIEKQVFKDLSLSGISALLKSVLDKKLITEQQIKVFFQTKSAEFDVNNIKDSDRSILAELSSLKEKKDVKTVDKSWFKRIDHGEMLGEAIIADLRNLDGKHIKSIIDGIITFAYGD